MKNLKITSHVAVVILMLALVSTSQASDVWTQVTSPNIGSSDNVLHSVAANSATDIWAVGDFAPDSNPNITQTLVNHFDGTAWSVVPSPNVGTLANAFYGVTVKSGKAFAVGYFLDGTTFTPRALIEAWDGTQWKVVPSPTARGVLFSVSALSPSDVWTVGFQIDSSGKFRTLTEHFNGTSWSVVPSPNPGSTGNQLYGVKAVSSSSVWAVGQRLGSSGPDHALIEHWNGSNWSVVSSPSTGGSSAVLYGVSGVSDDDVRAGGDTQDFVNPPLALLEDGQSGSWSQQKAFNVRGTENHINGIASLSNDIAWAVGQFTDPNSGNAFTLIERGGDSAWEQETSPNPGAANGDSKLGGVAVVSSSDVWAVGQFDGPNAAQTLILHCCK